MSTKLTVRVNPRVPCDGAIENVIQHTLKTDKSQTQVTDNQVANMAFLEAAQKELGLR